MRKQAGRVSPVALVALLVLVGAVIVFFEARPDSETKIASQFMVALAKGDIPTLTKTSYMDGVSDADIQKKWEQTMKYSRYYRFIYKVTESSASSDTEAVVKLSFFREANKPSSYEEKYELPMRKLNGTWKVDVRGISRSMFPSLPQ